MFHMIMSRILTSNRAATTFVVAGVRKTCWGGGWIVTTIVKMRKAVAWKPTSIPKGNVIRTSDSLTTPGHSDACL